MRREPARVAAISCLVSWLLGCASAPATTPTTATLGKTAARSTTALPKATKPPSPASSLPATSTNLEEQIQAAVALRMHGDIAQATRALAQLVLVAPDDPRVLGEYGKALVQLGRAEDAVAFLQRAVEIKADDWTFYSALGVAYDQMDDRKNAKLAYDRALLLHPGDPAVLNNYAVSRMLAKDFDGAQRLLMQAEAAGGDLPKVAANLQLLAQLRAKASTPSGTKFTTAASEQPRPGAPINGTAQAAGPKTAAAVVPMQHVPSDTSPVAQHGGPKPAAALIANAAPQSITPKPTGNGFNPATNSSVKPANTVHRSEAIRAHAVSAQKTKVGAKMSASAEQARPTVSMQKGKTAALPALRTDD